MPLRRKRRQAPFSGAVRTPYGFRIEGVYAGSGNTFIQILFDSAETRTNPSRYVLDWVFLLDFGTGLEPASYLAHNEGPSEGGYLITFEFSGLIASENIRAILRGDQQSVFTPFGGSVWYGSRLSPGPDYLPGMIAEKSA